MNGCGGATIAPDQGPCAPAPVRYGTGTMKRALLGLVALLVVGVGWLAWTHHQLTRLPQWAEEADAEQVGEPVPETGGGPSPGGWVVIPDDAAGPESAPQVQPIARPPRTKAPPPRRSNAYRLRRFHLRREFANPVWRRAVTASRAELRDGEMTAGVVLDLRKVEARHLSSEARAVLRRARKLVPGLASRRVHVGLEDAPDLTGDFVQLGDDPVIVIGAKRWPLRKLAPRLGLSTGHIRQEINAALRKLQVRPPQ